MPEEFIPPVEREYFIGTLSQCQAFISRMDTMLGYPNAATKTLTYSEPREHGAKLGTYIVPLKSVFAPSFNKNASLQQIDAELSATELTRKTFISTLKAEGAFTKEET